MTTTAEPANNPTHGASAKQEGRLAQPDTDLSADPRMNPSLLATLSGFGLAANGAPAPITRADSEHDRRAFIAQSEDAFEGLYEALQEDAPGGDPDVSHTTETITGVDGNEIILHIYRPTGSTETLPCTVYVHGGGMTILTAYNQVHRHWCEDLAATGMVAIGVDFRNAGGVRGPFAFPAGLNDCSSAVAWVHANRSKLGISTIVLQGESGGGNLVLATALKAKQDGVLDAIDGVYAMVPYISGGYGWDSDRKLSELPSLVENDGYYIECSMMDMLVAAYDPTGENAENPLSWPYFATNDDLEGLPPHVISVNELDPLRDEGKVYFRKLMQAGVSVYGRVNLGLTHAADSTFRKAVHETYAATTADIKRFASSL